MYVALGGKDAAGVILPRVQAVAWNAARGAVRQLGHLFMLPPAPGCAGTVAC
jgi:hypothetical protein